MNILGLIILRFYCDSKNRFRIPSYRFRNARELVGGAAAATCARAAAAWRGVVVRSLCVPSPCRLSQHLHVVRLGGRKMLTVALLGGGRGERVSWSFSLVTSSRGILNIQSLNELTSREHELKPRRGRSRTSGAVSTLQSPVRSRDLPYSYTVRIGERDRAGESTTSHSYKI